MRLKMNLKKGILLLSLLLFGRIFTFGQIPNPGFENWTAGEPDGWRTENFAQLISVVQSSNAHTGNSSVRLQVYDEFGSMSCGGLWLDNTIALTVIPSALTGWYQFNPTGGETIQLEGYVTDPPINGGTFYSQDFFPPAASWTPFSMPIDYSYTPVSPDSASFYFLMYCGPQSTLNTYLLLDDLAFDIIVGVAANDPTHLKTSSYPNPASEEIYIGFEAPAPDNVSIEILDLAGQVMAEREAKVTNIGWTAERFDTHNLAPGMYLVQVRMGEREAQLRIQVVR